MTFFKIYLFQLIHTKLIILIQKNPSFSAIALHILSKNDVKERLVNLIQAFNYIPFYCFSERRNVDHFFKNNSQAFDEIIHSHELIDTIEYYLPLQF